MEFKEFKEKLFKKAKDSGFEQWEIYYEKISNLNIVTYEKQVDQYSVSDSMGINFRGIVDGNMGSAYTEILDDNAIDMLINRAKENSSIIDSDEQQYIYGKGDNYEKIDFYNPGIESPEEKIQFTLDLEKEALKDKEVLKVAECDFIDVENQVGIVNSKGLDLNYKNNYVMSFIWLVIQKNNAIYDGLAIKDAKALKDIDIKKLAEEAIEEAKGKIGAEPVESGKYKVVIKNTTMAELLMRFIEAFNGEYVDKGLSLLKGMENKIIASSKINLIDNPHLKNGASSKAFDGEGVPTYKKYLIKEGVLNTFLHNLATAKKFNVKSTGNAIRSSYNAPISIAPTNCYIENGTSTLDTLFEKVDNGVYITSVDGLHSGANEITGDFSLSARGFVIENGKKAKPIEQITISGNFLTMLKDIEDIGDDLKFTTPSDSFMGSPSVIVKELYVSGK